MTQTAFNINLKLFKIISNEKLPCDFNHISKILMNDSNDEIEYEKNFYCNICLKFYSKSEVKNRRECAICNTK